ncbi:hypothetical protein ACT3TS_09105 [Specibacter sp. AOP5-B1-6]|uniref:hypothetical protein n=1 Tax=Specibacter sp. AOP5-B1-6 TaxID=3457653 RepID=UPI00402BE8FF
MREWFWRHRTAAIPLAIVLVASAGFFAYLASGSNWPPALFMVVFNVLLWTGLFWLNARAARKRRKSLEARGIIAFIRYPGSRPGSLDDVWACGTADCQPRTIIFQEIMSGTEVPLGKPVRLDVVSVAGTQGTSGHGPANILPPGLKVLTLALTRGTVDIAAEPSALARIEQEVFRPAPAA